MKKGITITLKCNNCNKNIYRGSVSYLYFYEEKGEYVVKVFKLDEDVKNKFIWTDSHDPDKSLLICPKCGAEVPVILI